MKRQMNTTLAIPKNQAVSRVPYSLAVMGILLSVISVSGEQMIGFEQRRCELAVLRSQGMSIGQLSKMLFIETLLTALIPIGGYTLYLYVFTVHFK